MLKPSAPPEALLDRFVEDCRTAGPVDRGQRFGVAVSGGPDSLALLLLAAFAFERQVEAVTVDHRLRSEAATEARHVGEICVALGVPHVTIELLRKPPRGNLSAKYRELRYAQMLGWAKERQLDWLMTGHHADDQLETVIMRLNRGSGVAGLSAIRRRNGITLRPLLGWRRAELAAIVRDSGLTPFDDPTNHDERYDRARLRKALAGADWLNPLAVAHSATAMEEADAAINWATLRLINEHARARGEAILMLPGNLPVEMQRRILLACLHKLKPGIVVDGPKLGRFHAALSGGRAATVGGVMAKQRDGGWLLSLAPPRRTD